MIVKYDGLVCPECVKIQKQIQQIHPRAGTSTGAVGTMPNIQITMGKRSARYGDFTDQAGVSDALINVCQGNGYGPQTNFSTLDPVKRQAIRLICEKLGRILSPGGDPEYRDNWHDIQGYAKLAEDRCKDGDEDKQQELPIASPPSD